MLLKGAGEGWWGRNSSMVKKSNVQICRWCAKCQTCQYSNLYKLLYKGVAKVAQLSSKIGASCSRYGWSTLGSAPLLQSTGASNARGVDRNFLPRIPSLFRKPNAWKSASNFVVGQSGGSVQPPRAPPPDFPCGSLGSCWMLSRFVWFFRK
jgi:hypothetical protein